MENRSSNLWLAELNWIDSLTFALIQGPPLPRGQAFDLHALVPGLAEHVLRVAGVPAWRERERERERKKRTELSLGLLILFKAQSCRAHERKSKKERSN